MLDHQPTGNPGSLAYGYVVMVVGALVFLAGVIQRLWKRVSNKTDAQVADLRKEVEAAELKCEQLRDELSSAKQSAAAARERHARDKAAIIERENEMLRAINEDLRRMNELSERGINGRG